MNLEASAIHFDMLGSSTYVGSQATRKMQKPDEFTPVYRNVHIKDVVIENASYFLKVAGIPESPARNVEISNVESNSKNLILINDMNGLKLKNAVLQSADNKIQISDGRNLHFEDIRFRVNGGKVLKHVDGELSENIYFKNCKPSVQE